MAEENFVHKTLDRLLDVIEVELKLPLGIAEVKMSPTAIAKEWRENEKKRNELENAIRRAEERFVADHKEQKVAQMLREFPLHAEDEFRQVVAGLLTHLREEEITWLAEVQVTKTWGNVASAEEIRKALKLYLPYLRHELNGIKEFREVISALTLERVDKNTQETVEIVREIRSDLKEALRSRDNVKEDEPNFWFIPHPYPMPPNFTGRKKELEILDNWLAENTNHIFILRALGGFGKSALAWQWINTHVNPAEWTKLIWWSFYEGDASFEHFIEETLKYLKLEVPQGQRPQVDALLKAMQGGKILIIMDGFERALRAYSSMNVAYQREEEKKEDNGRDCVNINAEIFLKNLCALPNIQGKVLMTTRLTPHAVYAGASHDSPLQGFLEVELTSMQPTDAVEFFHKQKIKGTHAEIEAACAPYGYHPLSLRLLAGRILKDFENPADIVVAQKLIIDGDIIQQKHHVLEVSYNSLLEHEQKLLSTIACFRSPVELKTLEAIAVDVVGTRYIVSLQDDLRDLVARGLLHFNEKNKKFDLHPIVRRYAYERLTAPDRTATHTRLIDYFDAIPKPEKVEKLGDLAPVIELYHHMVGAGNLDEALKLFYDRLTNTLYFQFGAYQLCIELLRALFPDGEDAPPRLKRDDYQAWAVSTFATVYSLSGQPRRAIPLYEIHNAIYEKAGEKKNLAIGLGAMAYVALLPIYRRVESRRAQSVPRYRPVPRDCE